MSTSHATPENIAALAAAIPGLDPVVAAAWLRCEAQAIDNPTNPLNIRYGPYRTQVGKLGGFGTYRTPQDGLADAGWLITRASVYAGVRAALNAHGTKSKAPDPRLVASAIEQSAWAAGHYGGGAGKAGCIVRGIPSQPGTTPPPLPKPPKPAVRRYTVRPGDSLWGIAAAFYHDGARWHLIYDANRKAIGPNPSLIHPGLVLVIPEA